MRFFIIPVCLTLALALPPAISERSLKRFFVAFLLSALGIVVPVGIFLLSAFLVPEWKGGCRLGWLDCFYVGKLLLTPLVLWAVAALYETDILRHEPPFKTWVGQGLFLGTMVSSLCFVFGVAVSGAQGNGLGGWLLVPLYTAVWFWVRTIRWRKELNWRSNAKAFGGSLPLWIGSLIWARGCYSQLPDQPPSCFVVTAASRGHGCIVGPFFPTSHHGRMRQANGQLLVFWQLEALWRERAPLSHAMFRRIYNRLGKLVARRINSPWRADLTCVLLKPAEWLARMVLCSSIVLRRRGIRP